MDELIVYLGESIICLGIFYSAYWIALRKGTRHNLSRFYLLGILFLASLLPLHVLSIREIGFKPRSAVASVVELKQGYKTIVSSFTDEQAVFQNEAGRNKTNQDAANIPGLPQPEKVSFKGVLFHGLIWVYLAGVFILVFRFVWQVGSLRHQIIHSAREHDNGIVFVFPRNITSPYSFLNYLFLPASFKDELKYNSIVEHEKAHIKQRHTFDLFFVEILTALFWINPFVWLTRIALRKTHEYLADKQVIKTGVNLHDYQTLLLEEVIASKHVGLSSAFHFKPLNQRLAMIQKLSISASKRFRTLKSIPMALVIILALAVGVVISCAKNETHAFQMVSLQGEGMYFNFSTTNIGYVLKADSINPTIMLARSGDLLAAFDDFIYYKNEDAYQFSESKGALYNNGKLFSIRFSDDPKMNEILSQPDTTDLSALEHITFTNKLIESDKPLIKRIAERKPGIGLNFESWNSENSALLANFQPRWLAITCDKLNETLPSLPEIEMLTLSVDNGIFEKVLRNYPKLKHLVLTDMKSRAEIDTDFLINNPQLESIVIAECAFTNFDFLSKVSKLKSFTIINTDTSINLAFLENLQALDRLCILVNNCENWEMLEKCKHLNWLAISGDIAQAEFDKVVSANPDLQVVEIASCDNVQSLESLSNLHNLKALTVSDTLHDANTPLKLTGLAYLSVPDENLADSVYRVKLQEALPNSTIIPNDGFCMGSGWMIFFVPCLFVLGWLQRRFRYCFVKRA